MVRERIQKVTYDKSNDVLYVSFANAKGPSYATDGPFGIEIMRDWDTEEITGLMVYYPRKELTDRQRKLDALGFGLNLSEMVICEKS